MQSQTGDVAAPIRTLVTQSFFQRGQGLIALPQAEGLIFAGSAPHAAAAAAHCGGGGRGRALSAASRLRHRKCARQRASILAGQRARGPDQSYLAGPLPFQAVVGQFSQMI